MGLHDEGPAAVRESGNDEDSPLGAILGQATSGDRGRLVQQRAVIGIGERLAHE